MVIEDDKDGSELLARLISRLGLKAIQCDDGLKGIKQAKQRTPIAITLDIQMEDLDGWHTLKILKSDPRLCDIPVIVVTVVDDKARALELGAFGYLAKPVAAEELEALLQKCRTICRTRNAVFEETVDLSSV